MTYNPDPNEILELLRVNGLTPQSPQAEITALLAKAGYTPEEIDYILKNPVPTPAPHVAAQGTAPGTPMPQGMGVPQQTSMNAPKPKSGPGAFVWMLILLALVVLGVGGYLLYSTGKGLSSYIPIPSPADLQGK